jgi:hypothetical protein
MAFQYERPSFYSGRLTFPQHNGQEVLALDSVASSHLHKHTVISGFERTGRTQRMQPTLTRAAFQNHSCN